MSKKNKIRSESVIFIDAFMHSFLLIAQGFSVHQDFKNKITRETLDEIKQRSCSVIYLFIASLFAKSHGLLNLMINPKKISEIFELVNNSDSFFAQLPMFQQINQISNVNDDKFVEAFQNLMIFQGCEFGYNAMEVSIIGKTYEILLSQELSVKNDELILTTENSTKKKTGAFYTPDAVVEYILDKTLGSMISETKSPEDIMKITILDPAMGCGQFLLGAVNYVRNKIETDNSSKNTREILRKFAENCLYGIDLNPVAVDLTRISLWLETGSTSAKHLVCCNALNVPTNKQSEGILQKLDYINWTGEFPEIFDSDDAGFDIVLGNPPYISFSGRQAVKVDEDMKQHFKANFKVKGWRTMHSFFAELAIKHLSKRFVSFVVPSQVAHLAGYADLRTFMTKNSQSIDVKHWGENVFPDACTPAMTFVCDRTKKSTKQSPRTQELWGLQDNHELINKINQNSFSLDKMVADSGVHTGNCSKKLVKSTVEKDGKWIPVLEGKQIQRYQCSKPMKFLNIDYKKLDGEYFSIRREKKYADVEFIVRQTAAFPIVAPKLYATYFRNSALALYPPDNDYDTKYIVGILNSRLMQYFYLETVPESHQKAFPQVKVRNLRSLPIRQIDFENVESRKLHDKIADSVAQILKVKSDDEFEALDRQINGLVYDLYEISNSEIATIEENI